MRVECPRFRNGSWRDVETNDIQAALDTQPHFMAMPATRSQCAPARRMTFESARAQFPVLERIAYLNAGTFGPMPRAVLEAGREGLERDCRDGRSGLPYFEEVMGLRATLRAPL